MIDRFATRTKIFTLVAAIALGACSNGGGTDTGVVPTDAAGHDTVAQGDSGGLDTGSTDLDSGSSATDGATDGRRVRDMGPEINLNPDMCAVVVEPRMAAAGTDFVVTGMNFPASITMTSVSIVRMAGDVVVAGPTNVMLVGGGFTYHFTQSVPPGNYYAHVQDASFTCSQDYPLTVL